MRMHDNCTLVWPSCQTSQLAKQPLCQRDSQLEHHIETDKEGWDVLQDLLHDSAEGVGFSIQVRSGSVDQSLISGVGIQSIILASSLLRSDTASPSCQPA